MQKIDNSNISRLKSLIDELPLRDERLYNEHIMYEKIISLVLDGIWIVDANTITTFVNDKMANMLGYTYEEMVGRDLRDFLDTKGKELVDEKVERRKNGIEETFLFKFQKKNGNLIVLEISTAPIFENEKYTGAIAYVKEANDKAMIDYYKQIFFDISFEPLAIINENGIYMDINDEFINALGYEKNEIINQHYSKIVFSNDIVSSADAFKYVIDGNVITRFDNTLLHKDGSHIPVSWRAKPDIEKRVVLCTFKINQL